jgi:hypothetical protein
MRTVYRAERAKEGKRLILIYTNLPTLTNPLTDLFRQSLKAAPYSLRDSQIDELREFIQDPDQKAEVVFLCDS